LYHKNARFDSRIWKGCPSKSRASQHLTARLRSKRCGYLSTAAQYERKRLPNKAEMLRCYDSQSPGQHPRPEVAGASKHLTVDVRRHFFGEFYLDFGCAGRMHFLTLGERAP